MKFIGKKTIYTYELNSTERVALIGILSTLDKKGEIKVTDDLSKNLVKNLLDGFGE